MPQMQNSSLSGLEYKNYIGVKLIQAVSCSFYAYHAFKSLPLPRGVADSEGYLVKYPDGYISWSPKKVFESAYFEIDKSNSLTNDDIDKFIGKGTITTTKVGVKTTLVEFVAPTGFTEYATSSCIDPANYDENLGHNYAMKDITKNLWKYLGFMLQWAKYGLK